MLRLNATALRRCAIHKILHGTWWFDTQAEMLEMSGAVRCPPRVTDTLIDYSIVA